MIPIRVEFEHVLPRLQLLRCLDIALGFNYSAASNGTSKFIQHVGQRPNSPENTWSGFPLQCLTHSSWWSSCWQHLMPYWSFWGSQLHSVLVCSLLWGAENKQTDTHREFKRNSQGSQVIIQLIAAGSSFYILKNPPRLSPRSHGHQDLVVATGETLLSEDTYKNKTR